MGWGGMVVRGEGRAGERGGKRGERGGKRGEGVRREW